MGAIGGAMGRVFIGGGVGWATSKADDTVPYRDYFDANKYLVFRGEFKRYARSRYSHFTQASP